MIGESLVSTDGRLIGYDEGIKLGLFDSKVLFHILGNVYEITLGIVVVTELGFLEISYDGLHDGKLEGLLIGDSLGYSYDKVLGSDEVVKLGSNESKLFVTILVYVDGITHGIHVGIELGSLD